MLSAPVEFAFRAPGGLVFDSRSTRGRVTALLFITTYDWASQLAARRLAMVLARQRTRPWAAAVVLEAEPYAPLAEVFGTSLGLPYPVVMADEPTRLGLGPFGAFPRVPTLVVLDPAGREVWRRAGLCEASEMEKALARGARGGAMLRALSPYEASP